MSALSSQVSVTSIPAHTARTNRVALVPAAWKMAALLAAGDSAVIAASVALAAGSRHVLFRLTHAVGLDIIQPATAGILETRFVLLLVGVFVAVYFWRGLYPGWGLGLVEEIRRVSMSTAFAGFALVVFAFLTKTSESYSRLLFVLLGAYLLILVPLMRAIIRKSAAARRIGGDPVAVIGSAARASELSRYLSDHPEVGLSPVLVISFPGPVTHEKAQAVERHLSDPDAAQSGASIQTAVVALEGVDGSLHEFNTVLETVFGRVILVPPEGYLPLDLVSIRRINSYAALEVKHNLLDRRTLLQKRTIDLFLASLLLIACAPLMLIIAVAVRIESAGPVVLTQMRVGKGGITFGMLKFRTMYRNADQMLAHLLIGDPNLRREWEEYQKLSDDPRLTKVGRFLRKVSLDELPQLINVIRGEMSLVGPRPFLEDQREAYGEALKRYVRVRPGITGSWQTSGRNATTFADRAQMDDAYVRNWSVWLDLYILAKTPWVVLTRKGAY